MKTNMDLSISITSSYGDFYGWRLRKNKANQSQFQSSATPPKQRTETKAGNANGSNCDALDAAGWFC